MCVNRSSRERDYSGAGGRVGANREQGSVGVSLFTEAPDTHSENMRGEKKSAAHSIKAP